jgi:hypothetical protein
VKLGFREWKNLAAAYILAKKLFAGDFADVIIKAAWRIADARLYAESLPRPPISPEVVTRLYKNSASESGLRRLTVDTLALDLLNRQRSSQPDHLSA